MKDTHALVFLTVNPNPFSLLEGKGRQLWKIGQRTTFLVVLLFMFWYKGTKMRKLTLKYSGNRFTLFYPKMIDSIALEVPYLTPSNHTILIMPF